MSIMALVEDVSARVQAEHQLRELAERDPLTGLYKRSVFQVRLEASLARARRSGTAVALLFIDLDGFKRVNDSLGHRAGDTVLCDVALRLLGVVRESDTLARLGGDEFVILLDTDQASITARSAALRQNTSTTKFMSTARCTKALSCTG